MMRASRRLDDAALERWLRRVAESAENVSRERAMELLRQFCEGLAGASETQRRILRMKLEGATEAEVARRTGKSRQAVHGAWKRLEKRCGLEGRGL